MSPLNRTSLDRMHTLDALPKAVRALAVLCRESGAHTETRDTFSAASEHSLSRLGISRAEVEWLLNANYVVRAAADQDSDADHRSIVRHSEHRETYFVVTRTGAAFLKQMLAAVGVNDSFDWNNCSQGCEIPRWDRRQLQFQGIVVKRFRKSAPNQECVLTAFEEQGWPRRIDDPLPPVREVVVVDRLHETIKSLNRSLKEKIIRFGGDGTGSGVCWWIRQPPGR